MGYNFNIFKSFLFSNLVSHSVILFPFPFLSKTMCFGGMFLWTLFTYFEQGFFFCKICAGVSEQKKLIPSKSKLFQPTNAQYWWRDWTLIMNTFTEWKHWIALLFLNSKESNAVKAHMKLNTFSVYSHLFVINSHKAVAGRQILFWCGTIYIDAWKHVACAYF